jgi:hypothetical protein
MGQDCQAGLGMDRQKPWSALECPKEQARFGNVRRVRTGLSKGGRVWAAWIVKAGTDRAVARSGVSGLDRTVGLARYRCVGARETWRGASL